jgi:hypothetical protein
MRKAMYCAREAVVILQAALPPGHPHLNLVEKNVLRLERKISGHEGTEHAHTACHPPPAAAAALPPHLFCAKRSCTTKHMVNKSHTFSRLPPSRATETCAKHAALQRCGSRDIDAEYWCLCLLLLLWMGCGGRRCEAPRAGAVNTPPQHPGCHHVTRCIPLATNPLFALSAACSCSFQERVA